MTDEFTTGEILDDSTVETGAPEKVAAAEPATKKRGRPSKSGGAPLDSPVKTKNGKIKTDRKKLANGLAAAHAIAARMANQPLLALNEEKSEHEKLADAIGEILDYYAVTVNPVAVMWSNLAVVAASIYAPRFALITANKRQAAPQRQAQQAKPPASAGDGFYQPPVGTPFVDETGGLIQ